MKKNLKLIYILSLVVFVSTNIFAVEDNIPFEGGQYVTTWAISDLATIKEKDQGLSFWEWLIENGHNPSEYIKHDVDVFYIEFSTPNPLGANSKASGYISVPRGVTGPMPIVLDYYYTMFDSIHRATHAGAVWASKGFIVFTPHYLGQNKSAGKEIHPYLMAEPYGQISMDMLAAGKSILDLNLIAYSSDLLLEGVSEGGYATLAAAKKLQENNIPVTLAAPYAGPYNVGLGVLGFIMNPEAPILSTWQGALGAMKYLITTACYQENGCHPNINTLYSNENYQQKVKANFKAFLREPFASEFIDAYLDIENKGARLLEIEEVYNSLPPEEKEALVWGIVDPVLRDAILADPFGHPFTQFYMSQNIGMNWIPQMPILFTTGEADINVPAIMTIWAYEYFTAVSQASIQKITYPGLDHFQAMLKARKDSMDAFCNLVTTGT